VLPAVTQSALLLPTQLPPAQMSVP